MTRSPERQLRPYDAVEFFIDGLISMPGELKRWFRQDRLRRSEVMIRETAAILRIVHSGCDRVYSDRSSTAGVSRVSYSYDADEQIDVFEVLARDKKIGVGTPVITSVVIVSGIISEVDYGKKANTFAEPEFEVVDPYKQADRYAQLLRSLAVELSNPNVIEDLSCSTPSQRLSIDRWHS